MTVPRSAILLEAGGRTYERHGVAVRRLVPVYRGGEDWGEVFTRADAGTIASYVDREGYLRRALANVQRLTYEDLDGDGVREAACVALEAQRDNLITEPENFGAWSTSGGIIKTGGQADPLGGTAAYLLDDPDVAQLSNTALAFTATGDGEKALSLFVRQGSSARSETSLWDQTATTHRHRIAITWSGGVPVLATVTGSGTRYPVSRRGGSWWRIGWSATGVVAANDNRVFIYPAATAGAAADTGTLYAFGAQAEDATFPSSYMKRAGAVVGRAPDTWTLSWPRPPEALTIYAHFVELAQPTWVTISGSPRILQLGASGDTDPRLAVYKDVATDSYTILYDGGTLTGTSPVDLNPVRGDRIELCATLATNGAVAMSGRKNGGTIVAGTPSGANTLGAAWSAQLLSIGCLGATRYADVHLRSLIIASGVYTLPEMAEL